MNRRAFLAIVGGGVVLAAGGAAWRVGRTPDKALLPWKQAGAGYTEPRRRALSYAILAPNPHNRQPWLVDLSEPETVRLLVDTEKLLPHTDPQHRQITIGLGCFLELMVMAAAQDGYEIDLDLFPEGADPQALDGRPIAIARFRQSDAVQADPLFAQVMERRSVKEPYDLSRPVEAEKLATVSTAAIRTKTGASSAAASVDRLRRLTRDALIVELETPRTYKESVDLFRIGADEVNANPDGIDFSGPVFETMHLTGLFSREGAMDFDSTGYVEGRKAVLANADTAMAHLWQVTSTNTRVEQIEAGRDWMRIHLAATEAGLALQPLSQALQEYVEMAPHHKAVHDLLAPEGGTVQMLARLGYAEPVPASPRWPLEAKIV